MRKWILVILLVPFVAGQSAETVTEDFEDDMLGIATVATNPDADWYSYEPFYGTNANEASCTSSTRYVKVVSGTGQTDGAIEGKSLRLQSSSGIYCGYTLHFTPNIGLQRFDFDMHYGSGSSTDTDLHRFRFMNENGQLLFDSWFRSTASLNLEWRLDPSQPSEQFVCTTSQSQPGSTPSLHSSKFQIDFDFNTQTYTASTDLPGCISRTGAFRSASNSIGQLQIRDASSIGSGQKHIVIDNIGAITDVPIPPPLDDFDTGFTKFIADVGFKSPESQMLFAIIFTTLMILLAAWITSLMAEGPKRIWIIHGVASVSGIIMVLMTFLELWVFTLAFVLATVQVKGDFGWINTFNKKRGGETITDTTSSEGFIDPEDVATLDPEMDVTQETSEPEPEPEPSAAPSEPAPNE